MLQHIWMLTLQAGCLSETSQLCSLPDMQHQADRAKVDYRCLKLQKG